MAAKQNLGTTTFQASGNQPTGVQGLSLAERKHTAGPWEIVKAEYLSHDAPGYEQLLSPGGIMGGTPDDPCWVIEGGIEHAPDARLISAAPDMLEALQAAAGYLTNAAIDIQTGTKKQTALNTIEGGLKIVRAAISKATNS